MWTNTMGYPTDTPGGDWAFAVDAHPPEIVKSLCEHADMRTIYLFEDGSILLYGSPEQFEKFWTMWILITQ